MRRNPSAPSLKSDSGPEDLLHYTDADIDDRESIYVADATSSGTLSDVEKEPPSDEQEEGEDEGEGEEVTEGSSLLPPFTKPRASQISTSSSFYGACTIKDKFGKKEGDGEHGFSQSLPDVIYASPVRPHLPSPSASNPRASGTIPPLAMAHLRKAHASCACALIFPSLRFTSEVYFTIQSFRSYNLARRVNVGGVVSTALYLPYNWRTPAMVPYDVQAHPFNRAPNATPSMATNTRERGDPAARGSDTEGTAGGSSRDSLWSVEVGTGNCGCLSAIWEWCFRRRKVGPLLVYDDTVSDR